METPIHPLLYQISHNKFYIKREDLLPFSFGGNKYRKAVKYFEEILSQDYQAVVTVGSASSNHCRIIANLAKRHNIRCTIVSPLENEKEVYNRQMTQILGADVLVVNKDDMESVIENAMEAYQKKGLKPYFIAMGGHGVLGTDAYVDVYKEIKAYEQEASVKFDYIFFADGTGTTHAGLISGKKLIGGEEEIIGISVLYTKEKGIIGVLESSNEYLNKYEQSVSKEEINYCDDYTLGGYGEIDDKLIETIKDVFSLDGIPLDHVYTGKGFYGMLSYIKNNDIFNKNILFIHTGGTPIFFDTLKLIKEED